MVRHILNNINFFILVSSYLRGVLKFDNSVCLGFYLSLIKRTIKVNGVQILERQVNKFLIFSRHWLWTVNVSNLI